jgi:hypothetical protein
VKKGIALLVLIAVSAIAARADAPLTSWDDNAAKAWWTQNPTPDVWSQASARLTAQLEAYYKSNGAQALANTDFQGWLEHLEWVRLGIDGPNVVSSPDNLKTFIALGSDSAVSHLFVRKLDPANVGKRALLNLLRLAQSNFDDLNAYPALGVAFSLVFDKPFPNYWPHPQVAQSAVPIGDVDVVARFNFYVQSDRDKKLDVDLTQQSFENLRFLVDSEVKLSELAYAQTSPSHISYSNFGDAFFFIKYDNSRAQGGNYLFNWGGPTYLLQDIETAGGICVDQAYYATMLGKGRGIPTLFFHGQGIDGGHAWFGYMSNSGKWELDCGRYENQAYPKGYALDPQTWRTIDDTQLANFFKNGATDSNYPAAVTGIAWAMLHPVGSEARQILDDARSVMPELAETWQLEAAVMQKSGASDDDQKTFYQSWITQFGTFNDMKVEGQRLLLAVLKKTNDPDADSLQQDIVLQNRSDNVDQGISGAASAIQDKIKANDWDGARLEYEKTIRDFAGQGGGTLYYNVIVPYVETCLKNGQVDQAESAMRFARDRLTMGFDSIIAGEFADLQKEVDKAKQGAASSGGALP